jgi:hypothetical protein
MYQDTVKRGEEGGRGICVGPNYPTIIGKIIISKTFLGSSEVGPINFCDRLLTSPKPLTQLLLFIVRR